MGSDLRSAVCVGVDCLPQSEETIDVGVMEPEDGVKRGDRKISHVSSRNAVRARSTSNSVDRVVNSLETVRATGGASAGIVARKIDIGSTLGEKRVNLVLQAFADVGHCGRTLAGLRVSGSSIAVGITESPGVGGERAVVHAAGIGVGVALHWVRDGLLAVGSVDGDCLITDHQRKSWKVVWWDLRPVPVGKAELICGTNHGRSACSRERVGDGPKGDV